MSIPAQVVESLADATGFSRDGIRNTFNEIRSVLGDRLGVMQQRVGGIMANAKGGDEAALDEVMVYTDDTLSRNDKAKLLQALGLGFVGGFLLAAAAGQIVIILVGLLCLIGAGLLLLSFLKSLLAKASAAIEAF